MARYKVVINLEVPDPADAPSDVGGSYTHMSRLQAAISSLLLHFEGIGHVKSRATLDKIIPVEKKEREQP
ncbi:MAG TPA: hypothetical protein VHL10_05225 [Nitrososphaera sp.]|jgi:hypothetical protein|nr:hypothetical protein [Nitrososphaera sp.]